MGFLEKARAAVIRFQESKGLKSDGIVGLKTAKVLGTPQTQVSQAKTEQVYYNSDTYEKAFRESIYETDGQPEVTFTPENFKVIESAILDENLEKENSIPGCYLFSKKNL